MPLLSAALWTEADVSAAPYDLGGLAGPPLTGAALCAYRALAESAAAGALVQRATMSRSGVPQLMAAIVPEAPQFSGVPPPPTAPEGAAARVADAASPAGRVNAALSALGADPRRPGRVGGAAKGGGGRASGSGAGGGGEGGVQGAEPRRATVLDYHNAYRQGAVTPSDVAEALISFLTAPGAPQRVWLCDFRPDHLRAQAAAATARYAARAPLSVLDGVPFAVKDSVPAYAHETGHGTTFLGHMRGPVAEVAHEAPAVAALRSLGAVCIGKTQMQEFGVLPTGISCKQGLARNPFDPRRIVGGSSGGSACVVAAGVCPFAIGTDGGGSVRIPAALCGVVGFKPTQGRMSADNDNASMVTLGPLAGTVGDALLAYAAMACLGSCARSPLAPPPGSPAPPRPPGALPAGSTTAEGAAAEVAAAAAAVAAAAAAPPFDAGMGEDAAARPPLALPKALFPAPFLAGGGARALADARPLAGVRVGVYDPWFNDADPPVVAACRGALDTLTALGATIVSVRLPELEQLRVASTLVIMSELFSVYRWVWSAPALRRQLHEDTRVVLALASRLLACHYLQSLRVRRRASHHWRRAFGGCDLIATPATACLAPRLARGAERAGLLHLPTTGRLLRFSIQANMLGLPAITVPISTVDPADGGSGSGAAAAASPPLPVSLQLIGPAWADASVLRAGALLEAALRARGDSAPLPPLMMPWPLGGGAAGE
ncbi:fatty acid amide hydrolase-like [Raphidocelis subcapitata]|uniref:Fatty acid amide hydrolase-like n=1 Tax=Raphidocelis subcapitata TaxID=307507 RepID=A0A2V0PJM5_9CHLO|nr:fatty acid amide hydrolase-like [Raphidocelis subcapitata]|eukprot:GBF99222.1 fatty acid amide hydrolase-like [Raphidocelis subcapitata]